MFAATETETIDNAPIGHLITAIVTRLNPLAQTPKTPPAPLEYRSTRRLASSLGAASVGTPIAAKAGGGRGVITSVSRVVQDGEHLVEILATAGASRLCRSDTEIVTWAWKAPHEPAPAHRTPAELAELKACSEAEYRERLVSDAAHRAPQREPQVLTTGLFAGMAV